MERPAASAIDWKLVSFAAGAAFLIIALVAGAVSYWPHSVPPTTNEEPQSSRQQS